MSKRDSVHGRDKNGQLLQLLFEFVARFYLVAVLIFMGNTVIRRLRAMLLHDESTTTPSLSIHVNREVNDFIFELKLVFSGTEVLCEETKQLLAIRRRFRTLVNDESTTPSLSIHVNRNVSFLPMAAIFEWVEASVQRH
jgi:hypothetical protein